MADNHFDLVIVWDNLGGAVRVNAGGKATVTDPSTGDLVTVVQDGQSVTTLTADANGRVSFVAQQGTVKLTAGGLSMFAVSAEQATAGAVNAAAAQDAQAAAEAARDEAVSTVASKLDEAAADLLYPRIAVEDVRAHGAVGDGVTDSTTAIDAAWAAAVSAGRRLYFPAGVWLYNGTGLNSAAPAVVGDGPGKTTIVLGSSSYLLLLTGTISSLLLSGVKVTGGVGVIRHTSTANNVAGQYVVTDFNFDGYSGAAISTESTDMPYWKIERGLFKGANYTGTIGVAFTGLTDSSTIDDCQFLANRVGVKAKRGGNNLHIRGCDFIRFGATAGSPRVDVWLVPDAASAANAGSGFTLSESKFGNENLDAGDYRILYADEGSGTGVHDRFPSLGADSTGYIAGQAITDVMVASTSGAVRPVVYSTTPNIRSSRIGPITLSGSLPSHLVQFRTPPPAGRNNLDNILGPVTGLDLGTEVAAVFPVSNGAGVGHVVDPQGFFATLDGQPARHPAGDPADYVSLLTAGIRSMVLFGTTTRANITDAIGGADAAEVTYAASGSWVEQGLTLASITVGQPVWIECDLASGDSSGLSSLRVWVQYTAGGAMHWRRVVPLTAGWRRHRFLWTPREKTAATKIFFEPNGVAGTAKIGRVRVYHAKDPLAADLILPASTTSTTAPAAGAAGALPATPAGYVSVSIGGVLRQIAYY